MQGEPGLLQRPLDRPCGKKECEAKNHKEESEDDDKKDDGDEDDDDDDKDHSRRKHRTRKSKLDAGDKAFRTSGRIMKQLKGNVTTRNQWNSDNPPTSSQCRGVVSNKRVTSGGSDSSLSPAPSDDFNPFGEDLPPKISPPPPPPPQYTSTSTPSRRGTISALREQFQGLSILGLATSAGDRYSRSSRLKRSLENTFPSLSSSSATRPTMLKRPAEEAVPPKHVDKDGAGNEDTMDVDSMGGTPTHRPTSETGLKPAIKRTDYVYIRPGRVTRSVSAAQIRSDRLREQRRSLNGGTAVQPYQNSSPRLLGPDGTPIAKRVRFAAGSKETSGHVVLELPSDQQKKKDSLSKK
ncbi:hypothetical protein TWF718_005295 [Orbilia javanica]|uniref:Uncharacterized protein n=1 Tax=Orbilia javanica TaxID=47235 RepID=A0AAN8RJA5_9PEZI